MMLHINGQQHIFQMPYRGGRGGTVLILLALMIILVRPGMSLAQPDICGCNGHPLSLGAFNSADESTFPSGTVYTNPTITIPLPIDGVLIFDSFTVALTPAGSNATIKFERNARNTPVTLLVAGDVTIESYQVIDISGENGTGGSTATHGGGGLGGPGGFRGGDGAFDLTNFVLDGGAGFGPEGGEPGMSSGLTTGGVGTYSGTSDLLPLVGGCGGGGGATGGSAGGCTGGGGGGGGGGAILIAANGIITVDGQIKADGGSPGSSSFCGSTGGTGSGGGIRLVADTITVNGYLYAYGGNTSLINPGAIRLETNDINMTADRAVPQADVDSRPGPVKNPITPTVNIVAVNDDPVLYPPEGGFGEVDIILPMPGLATIDLETTEVPGGTIVEVTVKPRPGGAPIAENVTLTDCSNGDCIATVPINLPAGTYVVEAQATFQTP